MATVARALVIVAVVATCAPQPPAAEDARAPLVVPVGGRDEPATPSAAPPEPAKHASTTPGKIWCETEACDLASEVCCVLPAADGARVGHCEAKPPGGSATSPCCPQGSPAFCSNDGVTLERTCDEAADCASGERCCVGNEGEGDLARELCGSKCSEEACLLGGTCPNGNACVATESASRCPLQIRPPLCGDAKCQTGQACCWSEKAQRGECRERCTEGDIVFRCTSPDQCSPHDCNIPHTGMPIKEYSCGGGVFVSAVLCRTLADCPEHIASIGSYPGAPRATACTHSADLPPGVNACDYE